MSRSAPEVRRLQRARRKARRLASNLCLHGLCCPNPANTEAERVEQARAAGAPSWDDTSELDPMLMGNQPCAGAPRHTSCPTHRTRAGRRKAAP